MTQRLIETWLPIAALGEESVRERRSMTALPPVYYLHVWWARRPLVAARAAVLASLLPADADREKFMHVLGIHGDPVASRRRIDEARRKGERFEGEAYSYPRAFSYCPSASENAWFHEQAAKCGAPEPVVLDPTAGGGSIPFEAIRLGAAAFANDLNPVATLIMRATVEWPALLGFDVLTEFKRLAGEFVVRREERLKRFFPPEPDANSIPTNYLWARTIACPYCDGLIPLSPNWRLAPDGTGVRLRPDSSTRRCTFEIVDRVSEQSKGTVKGGDAECPYTGCGRIVDGDEVKRQA
jgi:adenine-specific DNA methylase